MSKMGGIQSNRRRSGTNGNCRSSKWKDTSTIDSNNIIHQSRRRSCNSGSNDSNKSSRRRININWNGDDNGSNNKPSHRGTDIAGTTNNTVGNSSSLLGKRKKPSATNIDAAGQHNSNIDPKMSSNGNSNIKHDTSCPSEPKELSTNKSSDNSDISEDDLSQPSMLNTDKTIEQHGNIDPKMNIDSNCPIEQKENDNNDSSDSGISYKQKEPMTNDDTSGQQHSINSDANKSSTRNNKKQDNSCLSERKELSISKKVDSTDSDDRDILCKQEQLLKTKIDTSSQQNNTFMPRFSKPQKVQEDGFFSRELRSTKFQKSQIKDEANPGKQAQVADFPQYHQLFQHSNINADKNRISNNKQDISILSKRKDVSISTISDNDSSSDTGILDQGKELPITNIDTSSQRETSNSTHNNKDDSSILSERKGISMIDMDTAKGIVQHACAEALLGSHCSNHYDIRPPNTDNDDDIRCQNEFEEFVTSTISRAIRSIVAAKIKTRPSISPPQNATPRPTKKRRISSPHHQPQHWRGSKVEDLEHADSLHTMCSLFPLKMESTEDEEKESIASEPETMGFGNHDYAPVSESEVESNHSSSDHDSLLPPVGTGWAPTTPRNNPTPEYNNSTIISCETTLASIMPELPSAPRLSPRRLRSSTRSSTRVFIRPSPLITITNTDMDATVMSQTDLQPKPSSLSHEMSSHSSASDDDDDDYDYEHPLIGVFGDEGSGIISSQLGMDQYDDDDCIIRLTKVGSGIRQEVPPFHIDIGPR